MIFALIRKLLMIQESRDLSSHRLHTTKYEDLCM